MGPRLRLSPDRARSARKARRAHVKGSGRPQPPPALARGLRRTASARVSRERDVHSRANAPRPPRTRTRAERTRRARGCAGRDRAAPEWSVSNRLKASRISSICSSVSPGFLPRTPPRAAGFARRMACTWRGRAAGEGGRPRARMQHARARHQSRRRARRAGERQPAGDVCACVHAPPSPRTSWPPPRARRRARAAPEGADHGVFVGVMPRDRAREPTRQRRKISKSPDRPDSVVGREKGAKGVFRACRRRGGALVACASSRTALLVLSLRAS